MELQRQIEKFSEDRDWDRFHTVKNLSTAICVEAGELAEITQWHLDNDQITQDDINAIKHELADVMIYCLTLCNALDEEAEIIIREKMLLNAKKYPISDSR